VRGVAVLQLLLLLGSGTAVAIAVVCFALVFCMVCTKAEQLTFESII
jgi:hypothetical protein